MSVNQLKKGTPVELNYHLLDVFTNQAFGGNQLAVFIDAPADISQATMQKIAKEMNLAEITFVFPPENPDNDFRVHLSFGIDL